MFLGPLTSHRLLFCLFLIFGSGASLQLAAAQITKIPHADTTAGNAFGASVAIDGHRALVGASAEDVCGVNAGAAYIYEYDEATLNWHEKARLVPDECEEGSFFGRVLDLSGDRALIAASGPFPSQTARNAIYFFERDPETDTWHQNSKFIDSRKHLEGSFGAAVALEGDVAVVTTAGDLLRHQYHGTAYVYEYDSRRKRWRQNTRLTPSGQLRHGIFGGAVALEGDMLAVAASNYYLEQPGSVYLFERDGNGRWQESQRIGDIQDIFISLDLANGWLLVGESRRGNSGSGRASFYQKKNNQWKLAQTLKPRTPYKLGAFGSAVAFNGDSALIAGYDEQLGKNFNIDRVVYEFKMNNEGRWTQRRIFDVGAVAFGYALDAGNTFAVIGEHSDQEPGAAYVVRLY